ncbi:hypothetical protein FD754_006205 [Muntiacus muntjak]|uniref:Sperm-tail PG-rich repeat containing 4 n=1 Tax=Muntiacus muntjak TaxID=9888 RepID=A0A5N3WJU9_MUNMU|nr:hypothetical protein FD754_006205 [Muntiacus muntjak]
MDCSLPGSSKPTQKSSFEREGWWRIALTNTPNPGTYHLKTFIEESLLNPVIATYNFKNEGRKKPPLLQRNDPVLNDLPQYMPPDFLDLLKKQVATYSFKDKPRSSPSMLVYRDQSVKLSPGQYELLPPPVPKQASSHMSIHKRRVKHQNISAITIYETKTIFFLQREGPGPGHYDLKIPSASSVTSCFQSRVPRFLPACSKTPGPGAYTASVQFPKQPRTIAKMGREHSLFFNNTIGF